MNGGFDINGEFVSKKDAGELIRMLYKLAYRMAGEMHGMDRSEKFRKNWPNEYVYAESEWKTYIGAARKMFLELISKETTPEYEKKRMFHALLLERMAAEGQEADNRLQLAPNTQQFVGDKYENKKIAEKFGTDSNSFAKLALGSTALGTTIN